MYKSAIIGAGVVGAMIARRLSMHTQEVVILEKESDVAMGQSKANSGIVHAGYDPVPGSMKAMLNVRGSEMMEEECRKLGVPYKNNGTLVVGYNRQDMETLSLLLSRGKENGVKNLELIDGDAARSLEKNLSKKIVGALYAPTGSIVSPYELTINAVGNAMDNGAKLVTDFCVSKIERKDGYFKIKAEDDRVIEAEIVINCAGIHSDEVSRLAGDDTFKIIPRYGEYLLLDKEAADLTYMTIFRTPNEKGKGVLATQTVHGNILLGPTATDGEDKELKEVTAEGIEFIKEREGEFFDKIPYDKVITQFTGARAHGDRGDFIIESPQEGFINVAAIESPGLSSAPAIGELVEKMAVKMGIPAEIRTGAKDVRTTRIFSDLTDEEKNEIIAGNPEYGRIICRCEEVTEGEILEAIRRNPGAKDVDGIKRRTRSGMGRCQGGFCMPLVMEILARELDKPFEKITKKGKDSYICLGRTKGGNK